jgi:RHS repeat-associated protein
MSPEKQLLYEHTYDAYDQSGILIRESLIGGLGSAEYEYDENGRKISAISPYYTQNCLYDENGNLIEMSSDGTSQFYRYDALSQLISENETSYSYDSHFNRIKKNDEKLEYNGLDELVTKGSQTYEYDLNGNLIHDGETAFKYDHLNRLTEAKKEGRKVIFQYDPLGRRVSKKAYLLTDEKERHAMSEIYLYDGDNELAAYHPHLYLKHLKAAGLSLGNDLHQPVAMELLGGVFAPILDTCGNVKKLVDIKSKKITHEYVHTAFGEAIDKSESCFNPWRCSGKRFDPETGLIYFGKRYYNPRIARWMTTDPAGEHDSSNLYQYLFNNPLKYCDPDGRFVFMIAIPVVEIVCGAAIMDTLICTVAAAAAAYAVHEGAHYVENWVNQQLRDGVPYKWDDLGWDPECPNIEGFEWKGRGPPSSGRGNWYNEETGESYHPDLEHGPPQGPHWDYHPEKNHKGYRLYPDGRCEPKP